MSSTNEIGLYQNIESRIYTIRGTQVMLDSDLAELFQVATRVLNQAVKRNMNRFPDAFRFQLTNDEYDQLRSQFVTLEKEKALRSQFVTLEDKRGKNRKAGTRNDKPIAHGGGIRGINYNLFSLAGKLHPDLSVIEGFEGMEGNGPNSGTPVDHRVCVVGMDWLASDRVALELMGINVADVGYLNYCADAGMGEWDLAKIEVVGQNLNDHIRKYKLNDNIETQLIWKQAAG